MFCVARRAGNHAYLGHFVILQIKSRCLACSSRPVAERFYLLGLFFIQPRKAVFCIAVHTEQFVELCVHGLSVSMLRSLNEQRHDAAVACGRRQAVRRLRGHGVPVVIDRLTGERRTAQIFVAVLGALSFTYAQATWTQGLVDRISSHVGAFEAIGGVPALLVPDNTKVALIKACRAAFQRLACRSTISLSLSIS
jgi:hypothetical protein